MPRGASDLGARTPALCGPASELLTHPQGVRLDGHLLRGGAATRTVDHCTSPPFVPANRTRCRGCKRARRDPDQAAARSRRRRPTRRAPRAPCRASGPRRPGRSAGTSTTTSGVRPTSWIQRLSGVSQRAIVSLNAPPSPLELLPLLDGALAERLSGRRASPARCPAARRPRSRSPTRCRRRSRHDELRSGSVATPPGVRLGRDLVALRVLLPEDDARRR